MKLADYRIEFERRAYRITKNPLHAWAAYGIARQHRRDIPEWVLEYFDKARLGLVFNVPDFVEKRGNAEDLGPEIAKAFGLASSGRGSPFTYDMKWWDFGRKVREFRNKGFSQEAAWQGAKDAGLGAASISKIRRNAKLFDEVFDEVFPDGDDSLFLDDETLPDPGDEDFPDVEEEDDPRRSKKRTGEPEA